MNPRIAIKMLLVIVAVVTIFHLTILLKVIPYNITWGGRLKNDTEMYVFETISIIINALLGFTLLIKGEYLREIIPLRSVNAILWGFLILFVLNTIGNLLAKSDFEKLFAALTLALSILIGVILKAKNNGHTTESQISGRDVL